MTRWLLPLPLTTVQFVKLGMLSAWAMGLITGFLIGQVQLGIAGLGAIALITAATFIIEDMRSK